MIRTKITFYLSQMTNTVWPFIAKLKSRSYYGKPKTIPLLKNDILGIKYRFGFIPLGDLVLPNVNLANESSENPLSIHKRLKASQVSNFLGYQINTKSPLNIEAWEEVLEHYWDKQVLFLIRYGFPLDSDSKFEADLQHNERNHHSAIQFLSHVDTYLKKEDDFKAILSPFTSPPISNLHISPFLPQEKQGSQNWRVTIDLSFSKGHAVNSFQRTLI